MVLDLNWNPKIVFRIIFMLESYHPHKKLNRVAKILHLLLSVKEIRRERATPVIHAIVKIAALIEHLSII